MPKNFQVDAYFGYSKIHPLPPAEWIEHLGAYQQREFVAAGQRGFQEQVTTMSHWIVDSTSGTVCPPTLLLPQVLDALEEKGAKVTVREHRQFNKRHQSDHDYLKTLRREDQDFAACLAQAPGGQIEVSGFQEMIDRIVLIRRLYPRLRISILTPTYRRAEKVYGALSHLLEDDVQIERRGIRARRGLCRIMPMASGRLGRNEFDDSEGTSRRKTWDLILLPYPLEMLGHRGLHTVGEFAVTPCRFFSFIAPRLELSHRERVLLSVISGPVLHRVPQQPSPITTAWLTPPETRLPPTLTGRDWKQQVYYGNRRRNEYVTAVARSFATGDITRLKKFGFPIENQIPLTPGGKAPVVVILVESPEHGRALEQHLPRWSLQFRKDKKTSVDNAVKRGTIVTIARADRDGINADIVIVASGSPTTLHADRFRPQSEGVKQMPLLIVDFADQYDRKSIEAVNTRKREAIKQNWTLMSWPTVSRKEVVENKNHQ
ncbi:MAG TPA: hypothetical protein VNQ76_21075 [Planctomicrobium sp.]|nr:hypothetical protein [Planctomicrobium sp.]